MKFEKAQKIADALLYEGYLLYPYRASAMKNQVRWQFGVVMPREYSEPDGFEPWAIQTECLVEPGDAPVLDLRLRFLQVQARTVERAADAEQETFLPVEALDVEGQRITAWDEGVEHEVNHSGIGVTEICHAERVFHFEILAAKEIEKVRDSQGKIKGRIVRERWPIKGTIRVSGEVLGSVMKLRVRVENVSALLGNKNRDRSQTLRHSLTGAHTVLALSDGAFVSVLDPPDWARQAASLCVNLHTWPVLVGEDGQRDVMLSSPIILYDYPRVAPESPGDMFDATEIDEILALRTMTLTDDEKNEARATDTRAAALLDRVDALPPEILDRLHGAVRYLRRTTTETHAELENVPWWNPGADKSVSPESDRVQIAGVSIAKGSRVRLQPGTRRTDAQDIFLQGRVAVVEAVFSDVEDKQYLAVTLADDPAVDLNRWHGRFLYFYPDEIEPLMQAQSQG